MIPGSPALKIHQGSKFQLAMRVLDATGRAMTLGTGWGGRFVIKESLDGEVIYDSTISPGSPSHISLSTPSNLNDPAQFNATITIGATITDDLTPAKDAEYEFRLTPSGNEDGAVSILRGRMDIIRTVLGA